MSSSAGLFVYQENSGMAVAAWAIPPEKWVAGAVLSAWIPGCGGRCGPGSRFLMNASVNDPPLSVSAAARSGPAPSPGPAEPARHWEEERRRLEAELGGRITLDALTGPNGSAGPVLCDDAGGAAGWLIAQRKSGHRHSIDDVLTAWYALQTSPPVTEHLDLGAGIGTVGLLTLWGMGPEARLTCIEAQDISWRLLQSNIGANRLQTRIDSFHGDLREAAFGRRFPLITGSPPYFPPGTGVMPQDSQKAHARFELRGDVSDYAAAAARHLAPGGWFVLCFPSPHRQRALDGIAAAGLRTVKYRDVIPRETLGALFTLFACRHADEVSGDLRVEPPLTVRERHGRLTAEMAAVRRGFGFPDGAAHGNHGGPEAL